MMTVKKIDDDGDDCGGDDDKKNGDDDEYCSKATVKLRTLRPDLGQNV